jgi:NAD(P)H-flavin reductase
MITEDVLTEGRVGAQEAMLPQTVRINRVTWETDDTFTLALDVSHLQPHFRFEPGQFDMLYVFGTGECAISISSNPDDKKTVLHTIHRVGAVTTALSRLRKGDMIGLRGPFGTSWPLQAARGRDVCVVAGGIGIAPLRPLLYALLKERKSFGRIILLYGARSPRDLLYDVQLQEWEKTGLMDVLVTVDRGEISWKGYMGVVTTLFDYVTLDPRQTAAFVCGPETMMKFTIRELMEQGVPDTQIHLSLERNMKCGIGLCGHCQYGPYFICKDGPVFTLPRVARFLEKKEL